MNWKRIGLGTLLAALILLIGKVLENWIVNPWSAWETFYRVLISNNSAEIIFNVHMVIVAFIMSWFYEASHPRLGAGPKTGVLIGAVVWTLNRLPYFLGAYAYSSPSWTLPLVSLSTFLIAGYTAAYTQRLNSVG